MISVLGEIRESRELLRVLASNSSHLNEFKVLEQALSLEDLGEHPVICLHRGKLHLVIPHKEYLSRLRDICSKFFHSNLICHPQETSRDTGEERIKEIAKVLKLIESLFRKNIEVRDEGTETEIIPHVTTYLDPHPFESDITLEEREKLDSLHEWICFFPSLEGEEAPSSPMSTFSSIDWGKSISKITATVAIVLTALKALVNDNDQRLLIEKELAKLQPENLKERSLKERLDDLNGIKLLLEERFKLSSFKVKR